jgi:branched-chain amino acid transport system ATP-binding protein
LRDAGLRRGAVVEMPGKTDASEVISLEPVAADALVLEHVTKRFGGVVAIDDLSLRIEPGEAVGVIGPNGAGKSTLLRLIAGVLVPSSGRIELAGQRIDHLPPHLVNRRGVGLANQIPKPFPALSVEENVEVAATSHRGAKNTTSREALEAILEACQLASLSSAPAGSLGLLDQKRLELARVLASGAKVVLLDEVAAGLVGHELSAAIELISSIHKSGRSLVVVEHVQRVIQELVRRVVVIDWGRVIADGTPEEVSANQKVKDVYLGTRASEPHAVAPRPARATSAPSVPELLRIEKLTAGYGSLVALEEVDLTIGEGEVVTVLGANGAGKSTLAKTVSGHVAPKKGRLFWRSRPMTSVPAHERARLGIAHSPEGRRIFPDHTVAENLLLGARKDAKRTRRNERLEWVLDVLPRLRLLLARRAGMLSGGEQQMLAIGRALMAEPALLICDELSLGLAPAVVDSLFETLAEIRERDIALLLIEQNTHKSLAISERAYVLHRGRVTYAGEPEPLFDEDVLAEAYFAQPIASTSR